MAKKSEKAVTEAVQAEEVSTAEVKEKKKPAAKAKKEADAKSGTKTTKKTSKKESKAEEEKTAAADVILEAEETPQAAAENRADDMNAKIHSHNCSKIRRKVQSTSCTCKEKEEHAGLSGNY